jgi:hypothetical protein
MTPHEEFASREALIRELYAAFNRRDIDRVLAAMHPDVLWPDGWEGGHVRVTVDSVLRDRAARVLSHDTVAHLYRFEGGLVRDMRIELSA